ncbi:SAC3 family protein 1 [Trametes pubescens]|uniref:SAC3 family protein 1 n=1 Tax=Trametes pubescens TaxID=154538 RepID=A0A1M2W056_TRAPU|nr:SAC3 family protein 1 [Trametes pubescens]
MMHIQGAAEGRRPHSRNKKWVAGQSDTSNGHGSDGERRARGGHHRRGGRGRGQGHYSTHLTVPTETHEEGASGTEDEHISGAESTHEEEPEPYEEDEPLLETQEEREKFYQEVSHSSNKLVKQREIERKRAIAEGKMDDPLVPKRLDEAITMVGTCMGMCPRFERYRRERENNLDKWEVIPGTKRVDHKRAVKIYERAAGDKTLPSDLRPPPVLKKTLNYLFHDLLMREGFSQTYDFIRDRSRAVRNDFTMQHETGPLAIECHDRCARFHILALHLERESPRFSVALEEQQLMNTLQSLKEFYEDQRGRYQAPTELEMRVYHRLIHIRDQRERHEEIPDDIRNHAVFRLTTQFRQRVQAKSAPISKVSKLVVDAEAMQIFSELAGVLRNENNIVMIYLVACILERHFGKEAIEGIESIRGSLSIPDIIDGISEPVEDVQTSPDGDAFITASPASMTDQLEANEEPALATQPIARSATEWLTNNFGAPPSASASASVPPPPPAQPVFGSVTNGASFSAPAGGSPFGAPGQTPPTNFFGAGSTIPSWSSEPPKSAFGNLATKKSAFGGATFGASTSAPPTSVFGSTPKSAFGSSSSSASPFTPAPAATTSGIFSKPLTTAPLSSQPTWPADSPGFATTSQAPLFSAPVPSTSTSAPANSSPPHGPSLNPFAPSFVPPQTKPSSPSVAPQTSTHPPPATQPAIQPPVFSDPFAAPPAGPSSSPPKLVVSYRQPNLSFYTAEGFVAHPIPSTASEENAAQEVMPPPPTPSRIVDRRQTLWDLPGSSSPFSRLKTDRMTYTPSPGTPTGPSSPMSPTAPPPAPGRSNHMTLPPTPTARWFEPSEGSTLSRKQSMIHFPSMSMPTPGGSDVLSPIHITTPTGSTTSATSDALLFQPGTPALQRQSTMESFAASSPVNKTPDSASKAPKPVLEIRTNGISPSSPSPTKGKGKAKESAADLEPLVVNFLRRSYLVRDCWARWRKCRENSRAWEEACKRSESYQAEVQRTRLSTSQNGRTPPDKSQMKKRRVSAVTPVDTTQVRRVKRRKSAQFVEPLTDEALAQRLQENREENEKRWAQGSFRQTVVDCLKARLPPDTQLQEWCIWLSTNSVNDKTAIWLEHKFGVPVSGQWVSENVFCIHAFDAPEQQGSPGLIVFERSPLEGVEDEIERKYRVLDDCARLRDILETRLPPDEERFVPCLLVINWSEKEDNEDTRDFIDMTHKAVRDGSLKHVSYFSVSATTKELDKKFAEVVNATPLDTDDRLAVRLSWEDIRKLLVAPVESPISDLVDSCWSDDEFNWTRYDRVVVAIEEILNTALRTILSLFPGVPSRVSIEIPEDLQQPGEMGRGYTTGPFAAGLSNLLAASAQEVLGNKLASPVTLQRDALDSAVQDLENVIETQANRLRQLAAEAALKASTIGPSPKRRASQEDLRLNGSLSFKRTRMSPSDDGYLDTELSVSPPPSTSGATDVGDKPLVTVAMLRTLTRDVLKTYGGPK